MAFPPDDVLWEILLRLLPQPSTLLRASSISTHWRTIAVDPCFLRRHHTRHLSSASSTTTRAWTAASSTPATRPTASLPTGSPHQTSATIGGSSSTDARGTTVAAVYSSEKGAWGDHTNAAGVWTSLPSERPGAAVGDAVYWLLNDGRVLSLKLHDDGLTILVAKVSSLYADNVQLTRTADGEIGLTAMTGSALHILALETDDEFDTTSWVVRRTVLIDHEIVPSGGPVEDDREPRCCVRIVGVHDDGAVVFLYTAYSCAVRGYWQCRCGVQAQATDSAGRGIGSANPSSDPPAVPVLIIGSADRLPIE
ncbi:hypothetical protein PR202_ga08070 [Eleusine coracana subsp. coracana]|uniref:F-box domain-containing protein n=1 Tax=Eleusine coracana subsp. coracana TaxID=191504 RepID=A0AAV5C182_ELECO|nr:hypothetical protein PR202_ga08070 [Eleusine coracana subsp. coracana]